MEIRRTKVKMNVDDHPGSGRLLAGMLAGALVLPVFAWAQNERPVERIAPQAIVKLPPQRAIFPRERLQVATRPAIKFEPFEMLDPKTRKPIAPTELIRLPNGKQVPAKEYYDQLNQFEKWLTEHGQTVRRPQREAVTELGRLPVDEPLLRRQIEEAPKPTTIPVRPNLLEIRSFKNSSTPQPLHIETSHLAELKVQPSAGAEELSAASQKVNAAGIQGVVRDRLVIDNASLASIARLRIKETSPAPTPAGPECANVNKTRTWGWNAGDPGTFNAYVNGTIGLNGQACKPANMQNFNQNNSRFTLSTEGKVGGYVFHVGGDLLRLTGNLGGNEANNTVNVNLGVFVLGQDVYSLNHTQNTHWGIDQKISKGIDFSTSIPVPVGPFDINVTIGAQGSAGFDFSLNLYPMNVSASAGPFVKASVYAQAGLNVVIAEAGVGVQMTLVNASLNLGENAGIGWLFAFFVSSELYADADLDMLDGSVYVYAKVYYPCLDPFPDICSHQFNDNLFAWNGIRYHSVLFDDKTITPLHWS
jgi:hypothetical protein